MESRVISMRYVNSCSSLYLRGVKNKIEPPKDIQHTAVPANILLQRSFGYCFVLVKSKLATPNALASGSWNYCGERSYDLLLSLTFSSSYPLSLFMAASWHQHSGEEHEIVLPLCLFSRWPSSRRDHSTERKEQSIRESQETQLSRLEYPSSSIRSECLTLTFILQEKKDERFWTRVLKHLEGTCTLVWRCGGVDCVLCHPTDRPVYGETSFNY